MKFKHYLIWLLVLTVILVGLILALKQTQLSIYYQPFHPWLPVIFMLLTLAEHTVLLRTIQRNSSRFSQAFMAASSIKLLLILIVTVIFLLIDKSQVVSFVIVLFVTYLVFTVFEVRALLSLVHGNK
jgi:hypothetical protein